MKTSLNTTSLQRGMDPPYRRGAARWLITVALLGLLLGSSVARAKAFDEATVKAVFLYRLTLFVNWPTSKAAVKGAPLVIGTIGEVPFETHLAEAVHGEQIGGRPIRIQRFSQVSALQQTPCDMLYVGAVHPDALETILSLARMRQILTVSDTPRFADNGGMVAIRTVDRRIRIRINLAATRQAGLSFSAKLLKVAELISNEGH
ncbi:MAG: YfiR family protein [Desulfosarcinaceae bacterium]